MATHRQGPQIRALTPWAVLALVTGHRRASAAIGHDPAAGRPSRSTLLARGRWLHADRAARRALEADPDDAAAWGDLAASYAGLGWFAHADTCLAEAALRGDATAAEHAAGRATNLWALQRAHVVTIAVVGLALGLGLLALAIAFSVPFAVRELRLRRLPAAWRVRAEQAWVRQQAVRLQVGAAVLVLVVVWALGVLTLG
jgi:hypothetical protein